MKPSEFKISISVESYDEKTTENYRSHDVAEKHIVLKLSEISILNFDSIDWRLEWRLCTNSKSLSYILSEK